jgi:hypothetical protein
MTAVSPFEITQSESSKLQVCQEGQATIGYYFCTSGGKCIALNRHGESHFRYQCTDEFIAVTANMAELNLAYSEKRNNVSGVVFFIVVMAVGVVGIVVFTFFKNMNGKENEQVQVESDFEATRVCG